jgi:predicted ATP-grasp superfamily ATP-dependent carboligase
MIEGMHSVLDTVTKWALNNKVKQVMVLDGIAVEAEKNAYNYVK